MSTFILVIIKIINNAVCCYWGGGNVEYTRISLVCWGFLFGELGRKRGFEKVAE